MTVAFPRLRFAPFSFATRFFPTRVSVSGERMNLVNRKTALAAAIAISVFANAQAEENKNLGPVIVTANRSEVPVDEALASVTVLTRADIEKSQAPDLIDLLARQAGVDVARTGGAGSASTVFLRGSNSNHTLVLVDGIRVNPATQGSVDFAHIPLAQIERIEIVRGPRAALWGSDAIGGVIHIFTRDPSKAFFEAHAGSYGRAGATLGLGAGGGETRGGIVLGDEVVDGFSATNSHAFGFDPDRDGYHNRNLALRGQTALGNQRLGFSGLITDADVEFDQGETAALNRVFGVTLAGDLSARWTHSLSLGHSSEDLDTPAYGSRFGSARTSLDWINTLALDASNTLNVGLNWSRETGYSNDAFVGGFDVARRNTGVFASWRGRFDTQLLDVSLRHDDNSQFSGATTGNVAWGWQASDALRLRASWGQGFRAPNFNELYYPGFFGLFQGNPDLQPERSNSAEAGLDWQFSAGQRVGLSAYRTRVSDLISFTGINFRAENINRANIDGLEVDYHLQRGAFSVDGNATWQDARDASTGLRLLRRANRKLNLSAAYRFQNQSTLALDAAAFSARPDFGGVNLPGYARFDLRASVPLAKDWSLEARIENLGDRDYQLVDGYNTPGRSGMLNLRWSADGDQAVQP
jgi:vitamin B12 transporter